MATQPRWIKSSYSNNGGECVEVATNLTTHGTVAVRDSKDPDGPTLTFEPTTWKAFVAGVRSGDFTA
ncbi:DUF397 domain-containing protein [Streptomyces youssoufiensis]